MCPGFKSVMEELGALLDIKGEPGSVDTAVKEAIAIHKSLVILTPTNHLKLIKVHNSHRVIDPAKLKGHSLSHQTMDVAVPMVMLQHYVNPCLPYLIGPAMVTLILRHLDEGYLVLQHDLFKKFNFVRALFYHFEFSFYGPWAEKACHQTVGSPKCNRLYQVMVDLKLGKSQEKLQILLSNLLKPFLQGYLCICQVLKTVIAEFMRLHPLPGRRGNLLKATQKEVEELLMSSVITHPYSLSLDMYSAALQSLSHMDFLNFKQEEEERISHILQIRKILKKFGKLELKNISGMSRTGEVDFAPSISPFLIFINERLKKSL
ncbi:hypothetical protein L9F63_028080, partial [Diploptera punctata]